MEKNYYDSIIEEIQKLIAEGKYEEAEAIIFAEFKMPYLPQDFEDKLRDLLLDIKLVNDNPQTKVILSEEEIEAKLYGDLESQYEAYNYLRDLSLRDHLELIKIYLKRNPAPVIAALFIEWCIEEEIDLDLKYYNSEKDKEYIFNPKNLVIPFFSESFFQGVTSLKGWFESNNPTFLELCFSVFAQKLYELLPEDLDEVDGNEVAVETVLEVFDLMGDAVAKQNFLEQKRRSFN